MAALLNWEVMRPHAKPENLHLDSYEIEMYVLHRVLEEPDHQYLGTQQEVPCWLARGQPMGLAAYDGTYFKAYYKSGLSLA